MTQFHCCGRRFYGSVCPCCGYCPYCGRGGVRPLVPRPVPFPHVAPPLPWFDVRGALEKARCVVGTR